MTNGAPWQPAYIALGSNLEQPVRQVEQALMELERLPDSHLVLRSSLYRSAPMGPQDQPDYINAVAALLTQLAAEQLLLALQDIEQRMGRVRQERWGARIIDLDLLMLGEQKLATNELQLPHPGMTQRGFVIVPLAEIAPQLRLPDGRTALQVALGMDASVLERIV